MTYYIDNDDSAICPRCFANDPCEATEHTKDHEAIQCSRCDEDIREQEPDYPESLGDLEEAAWNAYQAGVCPCGDVNCGGIEWMLNGDAPFEF